MNAYMAIYGAPALERYAPGGQFSGARSASCAIPRGLGSKAPTSAAARTRFTSSSMARACCCSARCDRRGDRQIAEATIRGLPGVLGVTNQLRVAGAEVGAVNDLRSVSRETCVAASAPPRQAGN